MTEEIDPITICLDKCHLQEVDDKTIIEFIGDMYLREYNIQKVDMTQPPVDEIFLTNGKINISISRTR